MPESARDPAPLLMPRSVVGPLMRLYDYPHPRKPGRVIRGYDRHHALRTARMCAAVARRLGHPEERAQRQQIASLLQDLARPRRRPTAAHIRAARSAWWSIEA